MRTYLNKFIAILATAAFAAGCSSGSSSSSSGSSATSSTLTISGSLGQSSSFAPRMLNGKMKAMADVGMQAVTLGDLEIYAIAFTSPPVIASAAVDGASGSFSVDLPGAKGSSVTAIFRDKNDQSQVGMVVFQDTSKKDLKGNSKESSSITLSESVNLGNIVLGSDGKVVIPVSQITASNPSAVGSSDSVAVGTAFDPTGVWTVAAFDGTLPTGYVTAVADPGNHQCDGPCVGEPITLIRITGKEFTPDANCTSATACASTAGTDGADKYGLSIWGGNDTQSVGVCGNKIGFTADAARYHAHINIASLPTTLPNVGSSLAFGDYVFSVGAGFYGGTGSYASSAPYQEPWMYVGTAANSGNDGAKAMYPVSECKGVVVTKNGVNYDGWACKAEVVSGAWPGTGTGTYKYSVGLQGGGCFDANNKPVRITNWGNLAPDNNSCTLTDVSSTYGTGFSRSSCTYTNANHDGDASTAAISFTCSNVWGQFNDSAATSAYTPGSGQYLGQPKTLLAQNALCKSSSDTLIGYRCFAESYWQNASNMGSCAREYHFDYSATAAADFVMDSRNGKPKNSFLTNLLTYSTDGLSGTVEDEQVEKVTVQVGNNSSTFCDIGRRTVLNFKKLSDTKLMTEVKQSGQMLSTDAACVSLAKDALAGKNTGNFDIKYMLQPSNFIFYLTK